MSGFPIDRGILDAQWSFRLQQQARLTAYMNSG